MNTRYIWILVIFAVFLFFVQRAEALSARFTPKLLLTYHYNDNVDAVDPDVTDPTEMQWLDWLVGLEGSLKQRTVSFTLGGWAGYSQYIDSQGDLEELADIRVAKYNYYNLNLKGAFQYVSPAITVDVEDNLKRNRNISELLGEQVSEFSERPLYTSNEASVQLRFRTSRPFNGLVRYTYQTLVFDEPENPYMSRPADFYAHIGYISFGYKFNPRFNLGLHLEGGERVYGTTEIPDASGNITEVEVADYDYYQGLVNFSYKFSPRTSISLAGGAQGRMYFGESPRALEDQTVPLIRIKFSQSQSYRYSLNLDGEYSYSIYGHNLYFQYWQVGTGFKYYFAKPLYAGVSYHYKQDLYDRSSLDMENVWVDDRLDALHLASASLVWEALKKHNVPYLTFSLEYKYRLRDSNIDEAGDYQATYAGKRSFYDTEINAIYFQLTFNPSILIGPAK